MNQSETLSKLASALARVQGSLRPAEENAKSHYSDYADLGSIISASRELLAANGLSVSQFPGSTFNGNTKHYATLTTILMHESGEWLSQDLTMPLAKVDPQGYGSAITYARRYALASVLGIYAGEDDDADTATGNPSGNGQAEVVEVTAPATKPKPKTNGKKLMAASTLATHWATTYGYKGPEHVRSTMRLIGWKTIPNDRSERAKIDIALRAYRHGRDNGMTQDETLTAIADGMTGDTEVYDG